MPNPDISTIDSRTGNIIKESSSKKIIEKLNEYIAESSCILPVDGKLSANQIDSIKSVSIIAELAYYSKDSDSIKLASLIYIRNLLSIYDVPISSDGKWFSKEDAIAAWDLLCKHNTQNASSVGGALVILLAIDAISFMPNSEDRESFLLENIKLILARINNSYDLYYFLSNVPRDLYNKCIDLFQNNPGLIQHIQMSGTIDQLNVYDLSYILLALPSITQIDFKSFYKNENGEVDLARATTFIESKITNKEILSQVLAQLSQDQLQFFVVKFAQKFIDSKIRESIPDGDLNPDLIEILKVYPKIYLLDAIKKEDQGGKNILDLAISNPNVVLEILNLLPAEKRAEVVIYVLSKSNGDLDLLMKMLKCCPTQDRVNIIQKTLRDFLIKYEKLNYKDYNHATDHKAYQNALIFHPDKALMRILISFSEEEQLAIFAANDGQLLFDLYQENFDLLIKILKNFSRQHQTNACEIKDQNSENLIKKTLYKPFIFMQILDIYPEECSLQTFMEKNKNDDNILLLYSVSKPELLENILTKFLQYHSPVDLLQVLRQLNKENKSIVDIAIESNTNSLVIILKLIPERNRVEIFEQKDYYRKVLFACTNYDERNDSSSLDQVLKLFPTVKWLEVMRDGVIFADANNSNPNLFLKLLQFYPDRERVKVIMSTLPLLKNRNDRNVSYWCTNNLKLFIELLKLCPKQDQAQIIQETLENFLIGYIWYKDINIRNYGTSGYYHSDSYYLMSPIL